VASSAVANIRLVDSVFPNFSLPGLSCSEDGPAEFRQVASECLKSRYCAVAKRDGSVPGYHQRTMWRMAVVAATHEVWVEMAEVVLEMSR